MEGEILFSQNRKVYEFLHKNGRFDSFGTVARILFSFVLEWYLGPASTNIGNFFQACRLDFDFFTREDTVLKLMREIVTLKLYLPYDVIEYIRAIGSQCVKDYLEQILKIKSHTPMIMEYPISAEFPCALMPGYERFLTKMFTQISGNDVTLPGLGYQAMWDRNIPNSFKTFSINNSSFLPKQGYHLFASDTHHDEIHFRCGTNAIMVPLWYAMLTPIHEIQILPKWEPMYIGYRFPSSLELEVVEIEKERIWYYGTAPLSADQRDRRDSQYKKVLLYVSKEEQKSFGLNSIHMPIATLERNDIAHRVICGDLGQRQYNYLLDRLPYDVKKHIKNRVSTMLYYRYGGLTTIANPRNVGVRELTTQEIIDAVERKD